MNLREKLKEEYLKTLKGLIEEWKSKSISLRKDGSVDEAILEQIKVNVGEIFEKMFNISYNKSCKNSNNDVEICKAEIKQLHDEYMKFFDKIPSPWRDKALKDKEHNLMEEYYKEEIKLKTVENIKHIFLEHYERVSR